MGKASRIRRQKEEASVASPSLEAAGAAGSAWLGLALAAVALLIYAPVWRYGFISYDDPVSVAGNPHVAGGLTGSGLRWALTTVYFFSWQPMTWLSHMLDIELYNMNAGAHHGTSVLLHVAATLMLFTLLKRMTGKLAESATVAGLFAAHPIHVESVAWISERKDVLSTLFWTLAVAAYISYCRQPRRDRYLLLLSLFALGLMAKPMIVTLPFVLLLLDFWPLDRLSLGWRRLLWEKLPLLALALASGLMTIHAQRGDLVGLQAFPMSHRLANAVLSYVAYIGKIIWPARLAAFYPFPREVAQWRVGAALLALFGASAAVLAAARRRPYLSVGWFLYLGTLLPVIGLVQNGEQAMADRYAYVSSIGLFVMAVWGGSDLLSRWPRQKAVLAAFLVFGCALAARRQVRHWRSNESLWRHALSVTSNNHIAHYNLGVDLATRGRDQEAIDQFFQALEIKPTYVEAHTNLGNTLLKQGEVDEAVLHFLEALRLSPSYVEANSNLGTVLASQGKFDEAVRRYSAALRISPESASLHNNLAIALANLGRVAEALPQFSEALRLMPRFVDAHYNMAIVLAQQGKTKDALQHLENALAVNPGHQDARRMLQDLTTRGRQASPLLPSRAR